MTKLIVSIYASDSEQIRKDVSRAIEAGADMIELRVDTYNEVVDVLLLFEQIDFPFILTRRPGRQGGHSNEAEGDRLMMLSSMRADRSEKVWVDLEFDAERDEDFRELQNEKSIVSEHDFSGRPPTLGKTYVEMCKEKSGVAKLAWTARTVRDCVEAFQLLDVRAKPTITICMGEAGQISRILPKKFGAFASFASLDAQSATAPGQVTISDLKQLYRWDKINKNTKVFGVVGSPVAHSMSPAIHNASFEHIGFDGVYVPLLVNEGYESFKAFMESFLEFTPLDLSGLSITIPHKENALRYAQERGWAIDDLAKKIGAVNTFVIDSKPRAFSSDYAAILDTICHGLSIWREQLAGKRVVVMGAGGTGRTADVSIVNRTKQRAEALAEEFGCRAIETGELSKLNCDVLVNTTSVGMSPRVEECPIDDLSKLGGRPLVFDTIYNPLRTKLIQHAEAAGCKVAGGLEMFVRQAAMQFEAWTQSQAPVDLMRRVVESRLTRQLKQK
jgi:3-dehydroquinate dehydratase / shikimate dehydrogenase